MNLTRTYLTLLLICIAHLTHAQDKAEVEPKGLIKRYSFKQAGNSKVPFNYACNYDKNGRIIIDTTYGYDYFGRYRISKYIRIRQFRYDGHYAFITTTYPGSTSDRKSDTLEYDQQDRVIRRTDWSHFYDFAIEESRYTYGADGKLTEMLETRFTNDKKYGARQHKIKYAYEPDKEMTSRQVTRTFDDSGRLIQVGYQPYDDVRQYIQIVYSDAPQQPTPKHRKGIAREIDMRYYWHKDHHGNYLKKAWLKRNKLKGVIERTIEYYE